MGFQVWERIWLLLNEFFFFVLSMILLCFFLHFCPWLPHSLLTFVIDKRLIWVFNTVRLTNNDSIFILLAAFNKANLYIPLYQCLGDAELLQIHRSRDMVVHALNASPQEPRFGLLPVAVKPWLWSWRHGQRIQVVCVWESKEKLVPVSLFQTSLMAFFV